MRIFFGNCWVQYKDPIDLMDHLANMKINLYCYKKKEPTISGLTILWIIQW